MAIRQVHIGTNEDGSPRYAITSDSGHVVMTGNVAGPIVLPDGTELDATPSFIEVESPEQGLLVSDAIGDLHVAAGHPDFVTDPELDSYGFAHTRSDGTTVMNALASDEAVAQAAANLGIDPKTIERVEV